MAKEQMVKSLEQYRKMEKLALEGKVWLSDEGAYLLLKKIERLENKLSDKVVC